MERFASALDRLREVEHFEVARPDRAQEVEQASRRSAVTGLEALLRAVDLRTLEVGSAQRCAGRSICADELVAGAIRDARELRPEVSGLRVAQAVGGIGGHPRLVERARYLADLL